MIKKYTRAQIGEAAAQRAIALNAPYCRTTHPDLTPVGALYNRTRYPTAVLVKTQAGRYAALSGHNVSEQIDTRLIERAMRRESA